MPGGVAVGLAAELAHEQEDAIAIPALALAFLVQSQDPLTQLALESAVEVTHLRPLYERLYNTSTRVARELLQKPDRGEKGRLTRVDSPESSLSVR
ncbi:MAG: hypothetical protein RMJ85_05795 [Anaerolineales bacterium]|nr:hypothetical protein [Anaerolineales bacterium]